MCAQDLSDNNNGKNKIDCNRSNFLKELQIFETRPMPYWVLCGRTGNLSGPLFRCAMAHAVKERQTKKQTQKHTYKGQVTFNYEH